MMNNTYSLIISQSERAWSFQWARTLFALERRLSEEEKLAYLKKYSINLAKTKQNDDDGDQDDQHKHDDEDFQPGLMIIKRIEWTRAERRRLIAGYWQVSARCVTSARRNHRPNYSPHSRQPPTEVHQEHHGQAVGLNQQPQLVPCVDGPPD